jgi:acetyl esterase/lipase
MTVAISLRRRDEGKKNLAAQILLYPEVWLPFDTPVASENNSGNHPECNSIFSFADHYLSRGTPPAHTYISSGLQKTDYLEGVLPAAVFRSQFDPLRDVGVKYAHGLQEVGNEVRWHHYPDMSHGWLPMMAWSEEARKASKDVATEMKKLVYRNYDTVLDVDACDSEEGS